ncbi:MAG TPA: glycine--tRNA ligase subunit beta, partial [Gammaproteobacteria bacterium]|nr:glycine--tRNA ligase subunit beta [Gammaproteobacteria bacterium]
MTATRNLLIEIGTEELPPKALRKLSSAFADGLAKGLDSATLKPSGIHAYAAPRRLALLIHDLPEAQQDRETVRRGPALAAAFDDDGCPTQAAIGFAKSCGVEIEQLDQLETGKGSWLAFRAIEKGKPTAELIPELVSKSLAGLPIPKRMRWGDRDEEFVRPVHWVVLLFGDEVIDAEILGIKAGRHTRGHRFHHPGDIYLAEPEAYLPILETEGHVLADRGARREAIRAQVLEQAEQLGGQALIDEDLLDEVTALVEWPVAISGRFDTEFLDVPSEALISSMQDHQKYFPVVDNDGKLLAHFITIANLDSKDPQQIRSGNERVIRPRLADAAFFWNQDRKQPLEKHAAGLRSMVYQKTLGTLFDKQERVAKLAAAIATQIGGSAAHAERAAKLCKCDLLTSMVYEFPELQGIMGRYYASNDGEPDEVAIAIEEHYRPRFAGDELPHSTTGQALALADRLDSLVGIFAIGQQPSGVKDPFALRRAALGLVRLCIERELDVDLETLLHTAAAAFDKSLDAEAATGPVFSYVMDRLRAYYQDSGIDVDLIEAVLAVRPTRLLDFDRRIRACQAFRQLPEAQSLAAANKRISNILKKTDQAIPEQVDRAKLADNAEKQLAEQLDTLSTTVIALMDAGDYTPALRKLAGLRENVDAFFDQVMVMAEDAELRANRLALLQNLRQLFLRVADLSR